MGVGRGCERALGDLVEMEGRDMRHCVSARRFLVLVFVKG